MNTEIDEVLWLELGATSSQGPRSDFEGMECFALPWTNGH